MLINFGNLVNAAAPSTDTAYIQLLPLTNATEAAQDFASVRGGSGNTLTSTVTNSNHNSNRRSPATWLIALIAGAAIVLLLLVIAVVCCCRRRRRLQNAPAPGTGWVVDAPSYRPIHEPSPQAAYEMHMGPGPLPGYTPAYVPEYKTAWDARY